MKIKYSKVIPFKGFAAITLFGTIFIREELKDRYNPNTDRFKYLYNHESIHEAQAIDLSFGLPLFIGYIIFYLLYGLEYVIRLFIKLFKWESTPYKALTAEVEAYEYEYDLEYLKTREKFSQFKQPLKLKNR